MLAVAAGEEINTHNDRLNRINDKAEGLDLNILRNTARLKNVRPLPFPRSPPPSLSASECSADPSCARSLCCCRSSRRLALARSFLDAFLARAAAAPPSRPSLASM